MPVQILISPPAAGKTQAVIAQVMATVRREPLSPVWVVLPDQLQADHFRRRLASAGGAVGVKVGTFGDLYKEFLERAGRPVPVAPDAVAYRLPSMMSSRAASWIITSNCGPCPVLPCRSEICSPNLSAPW